MFKGQQNSDKITMEKLKFETVHSNSNTVTLLDIRQFEKVLDTVKVMGTQ